MRITIVFGATSNLLPSENRMPGGRLNWMAISLARRAMRLPERM